MTYGQLAIAGIVAAIIILLFLSYKRSTGRANRMSKFTMTLLLDEFLYQQKRSEFLKLIETMKVENSAALFYAAMFNLEDAAEKNDRTKIISTRMWQLNRRAAQTGESTNTILENEIDLRGNKKEIYPRLNQNVSTAHTAIKILMVARAARRHMSRFLGLK